MTNLEEPMPFQLTYMQTWEQRRRFHVAFAIVKLVLLKSSTTHRHMPQRSSDACHDRAYFDLALYDPVMPQG